MASLKVTARNARLFGAALPARSKFRAIKTEVDGITFDSKKEAERYAMLRLRELAGEIQDLKLQPRFPLVVNGVKVCTYVADFEYAERGARVVEDVKSAGTKTRAYRIKRKLLAALQPEIEVREVF